MPCIGDGAPDCVTETTQGEIRFHEWSLSSFYPGLRAVAQPT